jgi:hypothetical protein
MKAQSQDYLRNAQFQFLLKAIADKLSKFWVHKGNYSKHLNQLVSQSNLLQPQKRDMLRVI